MSDRGITAAIAGVVGVLLIIIVLFIVGVPQRMMGLTHDTESAQEMEPAAAPKSEKSAGKPAFRKPAEDKAEEKQEEKQEEITIKKSAIKLPVPGAGADQKEIDTDTDRLIADPPPAEDKDVNKGCIGDDGLVY
jgi:hypothetical protein